MTRPVGANLKDDAHLIWGLPGTAIWAAHGIAIHNHHRTFTWLARPDVREQLDAAAREHLEGDILFADRAQLARHCRDLFPK